MKNKKFSKRRGTIALSQIFLLVASTIAFSYLVGSSLPFVSAQAGECVRIKEYSSTGGDARVISVPSGYTAQQYCDSKNYYICEPTPCSADESSDTGVGLPNLPLSAAPLIDTSKKIGKTPEEIKAIAEEGMTKTTPTKSPGFWSYFSTDPSKGGSVGHWLGYIATNAAVAYGIGKTVSWGAQLLGADERFSESVGKSAAYGYFAGAMVAKLGSVLGWNWATSTIWFFPALGLIGAGIAILFALFTWKDTRYYGVTFSCMAWDAPTGGQDCNLCNNEDIPCTEYRCMSLGTHCEYLKEEQLCIFDDRKDTNPPTIEPWEDILTEGYQYSPDNAISPPNRGVKIVPEENMDGCVAPFTPLKFGIELDKPARCKIDTSRPGSFEDMGNWFMSNGLSIYNHSFRMSIPSPESLEAENITLREGGEFSLYIRCETRQGYSNPYDFVFNFCVDDGPDTQEPVITGTSIVNNSPVSYFKEDQEREIDLTIYTNEPAQCRWSRLEQAYEDMPEENQINCPASGSALDTTNFEDYRCESTTLTGLKNRDNNDYYISCIDQPYLNETEKHLRNVMERAYFFRLIGTQPLILDSAEPNNTIIRDSTDVIKVNLEAKTSAGFDRGAAICSFSPAGQNRFVQFFETGTHEHKQRLDLAAGIHSYDISCVDLGGNAAKTTITFTIETDTTAPIIVRAFREGEYLKIITDEDAKCVYSDSLTIGCRYDFEDGTEMDRDIVGYGTSHSLPWNSDKTFYIKCEDEFKNRPVPDQCSITARPYD